MAGRFEGFSGIANTLKGFQVPETKIPNIPLPDKRSRAERREDFEKELASLDKEALIELRDKIQDIYEHSESHELKLWEYKEDLENSVIKLIRYIDKFESLNSEESRKIELKKKELKLDAKHDWSDKFRLFFFRVLASALFIGTLFAIGYIEKEYDWATLPLSKYVKPVPNVPSK
jgi:hypothetical protein